MFDKLLAQRRQALARLSKSHRPYAVTNASGPVAEIRIYDEIWFFGVNAEDFARDLDQITAPEILVAINSPGGDVFDAIAIYNALRNHPAKITTRVDGIAASAASFIVQAGERRIMMGASQMMIHEPWAIAIGPASELRDVADVLDQQTEVIAGIYGSRSGKGTEHFTDMLADGKDHWFTDAETVGEGLADEISDPDPSPKDDAPKNTTLHDQVKATVDAVTTLLESAERVAALRAEKGKQLSDVNRAGLYELDGCLAKLRALLEEPHPTTNDSDELAREYARFVAITQGVN